MDYDELIAKKRITHHSVGIHPGELNPLLFPFQAHIVKWALQKGRCALFEERGLGKSFQEIEWATHVHKHTDGPVLILTPLGVTHQFVTEGAKFGYNVTRCKSMSDVKPGVNVTNYDRLKDFEASEFAGVALDESSVLKSLTSKTRIMLTDSFAHTPYKLCGTATPAPNDFTELGQHAEFLGVCTSMQMFATWFINDTFDTGTWRLKRHSVEQFWQWVASWAACVSRPSDIGYSDAGYDLPPLNIERRIVKVDQVKGRSEDELFRMSTMSATTIHREMKFTCAARVEALAVEVNASDEQWAIWCNTNQEADALKKAIHDCVEVRGNDSAEFKEESAENFVSGDIVRLVSKASIFGYGMNFQNCHNTAFVGLSYSFEDFYQALGRFWRFGQTKPVRAVVFQAETETSILDTIKVKMAAHEEMKAQMKIASQVLAGITPQKKMRTEITTVTGEGWEAHWGDCVRIAREKIASETVGFSCYSPPFPDVFVYGDDEQDMGNCRDIEEFLEQYAFLVDEVMRVTMPGRETAVHCVDLLSTKWKHGEIGLQDFAGAIVKVHRDRGWVFHSRITIWKSPVTEMQRTKAHGLLYKTLRKDSAASRVGCPDYLLVFRKPGENPVPIEHDPSDFPLDLWQEVASPVWMTIDQGDVLNNPRNSAGIVSGDARDQGDERHIAPLQLQVVDRALSLWSAPGDLVYSPYGGIGTEGVASLRKGRKIVTSELKGAYFKQLCENFGNATSQQELKFF